MDTSKYFKLTRKHAPKIKPKIRPLPKAKQAYLDTFKDMESALQIFKIKYEKLFQFKSTKHWRYDFHLIEHRILIEISGGPWSGGRKGKLANKAWSLDKYDQAWEKGYTVVRIESSTRYKTDESGPMQIEASHADQWLKSLLGQKFNEPNQTISTYRIDG
jgi:very-short-patch-repair endonuclease